MDPVGIEAELSQARQAADLRAWPAAHAQLAVLDEQVTLGVEDLERLAMAAHLSGHESDALEAMERVHHAWLDTGIDGVARAARWAIWLGMLHFLAGRHGQGGGWMARAGRMLDEADLDGAERGFLLVPAGLQSLDSGDPEQATAIFVQVSEIARNTGDEDLAVMGLLGQGQALVTAGETQRGAALLDEVMVAVTTGDVVPLIAGIAYCAVIIACRETFDIRRAQEWTSALSRWCSLQQGLHPFRGQCLIHRSEIMQLHGEWPDALLEVRQACEHLARHPGDPVMGMARYQEGELLRLCGELEAAEEAYREASGWGHPIQPGLALLRLAQGRSKEAAAAIARVLDEPDAGAAAGAVKRAPVLAAAVEVALATRRVAVARRAADELGHVAETLDSAYLRAAAASAIGAVMLADGDPAAACAHLRRAWQQWQHLDAPYEAAKVRVLIARGCRALGDMDTAAMEVDAARATFEQLGAARDLAVVTAFAATEERQPPAPGGLTPREIEVLREVATGATNREVAATLVISERTVARHLSNLFTKLGVTSRSAATAWAYEHELV